MNLDHAANSGSPTSFAVPGMHPELAGSSVSTSRPRMMGPAAGQVQGYARVVKEQPKRPLNSYNIFFQVERKRLIAGSSDVGPYSRGEVYSINLDRSASAGKVKRPHRKMHGMISFTDLAKTIASRWKVLDESQKVFFEERASEEKSKYATELEEWLLLQVPTPQVKKRLSALRRGSLRKYLNTPRPSVSHVSQDSLQSLMLGAVERVSDPPPKSHGYTEMATSPQGHFCLERQRIQLERAQNLERLYQMQVTLYNKQLRLQAECSSEQAPSCEPDYCEANYCEANYCETNYCETNYSETNFSPDTLTNHQYCSVGGEAALDYSQEAPAVNEAYMFYNGQHGEERGSVVNFNDRFH